MIRHNIIVSCIVLFFSVQLVSAQVLFESEWNNSLGMNDPNHPAISAQRTGDGGRWNVVGAGGSVILSTGLDFPTQNVYLVPWDNGLFNFVRKSGMPIPVVGESRYYRWYFRFTLADTATGSINTHPFQDGGTAPSSNWMFNVYPYPNGTWRPDLWAGNYVTNTWPNIGWLGPYLEKDKTYRFELQVLRSGTNTMQMHIRVYDSAGNLLYDDDDFRNEVGTLLSTNPTFPLANASNLDGFNAGSNNGGGGSTNYGYQGAVCIRNDTWCGAYVAAQLPPEPEPEPEPPATGICEATGGATCYYVDPVLGDDANDGNFSSPLRTPQLAIMRVQPGGVVYLRGGTYGFEHAYPTGASCWTCTPAGSGSIFYDTIFIGDRQGAFAGWVTAADSRAVNYYVASGTPEYPITVKSYPGEEALLDGYGIKVYQEAHWNIENLRLNNSIVIVNAYYGGSAAGRTHDITLRGNTIGNYAAYGGWNPGLIKIQNSPNNANYGAYNIRIENNILHDFKAKSCVGDRSLTPNCNENWTGSWRDIEWWETLDAQHFGGVTIMSCEVYSTPAGNCTGTGRVDIINNTFSNVPLGLFIKNPMLGPVFIQNNTLYNAQSIGMWAGSNLLFERNLVYNISSGATAGGLPTVYPTSFFVYAGQNYTIRYNTYVGVSPIVNFKVNASGHKINNNLVFDPAARTQGAGWSTRNYIQRGTGNAPDQYDTIDPVQSQFGVDNTIDANCIITPYPDFLAVKRALRNPTTGSPYMVFHNLSEVRSLWNIEVNSPVIIESLASAVFENPSLNDYRLRAGSEAATRCGTMGIYGSGPGVPPPPMRVGDLNGDGVVDIQDVILIIQNFKRRQSYDAGADINNDGVVNVFDMVLLGRQWG